MILTGISNIHVYRRLKATYITIISGSFERGPMNYSVHGVHPARPHSFCLHLHPWTTEEEAREFIQTSPLCSKAQEVNPQEFHTIERSYDRATWFRSRPAYE